MRATELRLGNYIQVGGSSISTYQTYTPKIVTTNLIKAIEEENKERAGVYSLSVFQPIKLTSEILEKCGFKKRQEGFRELYSVFYYRRLTKNVFEIEFDGQDAFWINGNTIVEFQNLHQLQNLYFSITGVELNIDL